MAEQDPDELGPGLVDREIRPVLDSALVDPAAARKSRRGGIDRGGGIVHLTGRVLLATLIVTGVPAASSKATCNTSNVAGFMMCLEADHAALLKRLTDKISTANATCRDGAKSVTTSVVMNTLVGCESATLGAVFSRAQDSVATAFDATLGERGVYLKKAELAELRAVIESYSKLLKSTEGALTEELKKTCDSATVCVAAIDAMFANGASELEVGIKARYATAVPVLFDAYIGPSDAEQIASAQSALSAANASVEDEFIAQLRAQQGVSPVMFCRWTATSTKLTCNPDAVKVDGSQPAVVYVTGLPTDRALSIVARVPESGYSTKRVKIKNQSHDDADGSCQGGEYTRGFQSGESLSQDELPANGSDSVMVVLHRPRKFGPSFGGGVHVRKELEKEASHNLRPCPNTRRALQLVLPDRDTELQIEVVEIIDNRRRALQSAAVPVGYDRWGIEMGGFFAISGATDQELVRARKAESDGRVRLVDKRRADRFSQDTGIWLSLIPRNYPWFGWGIGFHTESQNAPSFYVGPSLRLMTIGTRGLATVATGLTLRHVKRFPDVEAGCSSGRHEHCTYASDSPFLEGQMQTSTSWFVMVQLGFAFGPISSSRN